MPRHLEEILVSLFLVLMLLLLLLSQSQCHGLAEGPTFPRSLKLES